MFLAVLVPVLYYILYLAWDYTCYKNELANCEKYILDSELNKEKARCLKLIEEYDNLNEQTRIQGIGQTDGTRESSDRKRLNK